MNGVVDFYVVFFQQFIYFFIDFLGLGYCQFIVRYNNCVLGVKQLNGGIIEGDFFCYLFVIGFFCGSIIVIKIVDKNVYQGVVYGFIYEYSEDCVGSVNQDVVYKYKLRVVNQAGYCC